MAGISTASIARPTPGWPEWVLTRPQRPLIALAAVGAVLAVFSLGQRLERVIAEAPVVKIETTQAPELSREWRWQREPVSFDSMYAKSR